MPPAAIAKWAFSDVHFYMTGAPGDLLGVSNLVPGSGLWVLRLTAITPYIGAPSIYAFTPLLAVRRTSAPLGGGPVAIMVPLRTAFGPCPADVRFPPAAAVPDPGLAACAVQGSIADTGALVPGDHFSIYGADVQDLVTPDAPVELLFGEGLLLSDLIGSPAWGEYSTTVKIILGS